MNIEYDHSQLSLIELHKEGIRSPKELEEVIEWEHTHCEEDRDGFEFPIFRFTGLTNKCKGLRVVITVDSSGKYVTLDAKPASRDLIFRIFSSK